MAASRKLFIPPIRRLTAMVVVRNFTTKINTDKTIMEIEQILLKFGAQGIYKEYVGSRISGLIFMLVRGGQKIPFKIPMSIEKSRTVVVKAVKDGRLPQRFMQEPLRTDQGERVAWRIIKDWIDSQLSLMEMELADPIEILLPYAYNMIDKKTMYQKFMEHKEDFIAIENQDT